MEWGGCSVIKTGGHMIFRFWIGFVIFAFSLLAVADPLSVDLQKVKLPDLVSLVYGEMLGRSYVVDSSVLADESVLTLNLKNLTPQAVEQEARKILDLHGFAVDGKTVLHFHKREDAGGGDDSLFVYRPQSRSVSYLLDLALPLFKPGSFASQRGSSGFNLAQVSGTTAGQGSAPPPVQIAESGVNAQIDRDVDVMVFHGSLKEVERLKGLLAQVDLPTGEVMVKAVVYEVQTTKKDSSAVDLLASVLTGKLGFTLAGGAASALSSASLKLPFGKLLDLSAVYSAVNSDDRFKLLTSPRVRVKSGATSRFSVGNEVPILGAVSLDGNGRSTQSVSYKPSGVIFDISPIVREGGTDITVSQQISQFVPTTTGVNNSPTLTKRELSTQITAHDDEIIMLGGLDEDRTTSTDSGFSFFPSWLRSKSNEGQRIEVVLLLHVQRL